ncbi:Atp-binding protein, partial [Globisporangium polare]
LKRGGETVFFGDLGQDCRNLVEYFEGIPGVSPLPVGYNPATWALECIGAGVDNTSTSASDATTDFVRVFNSSERKRVMEMEMAQPGVCCPSPDVPELTFTHKRAASSGTQMKFVVGRFMRLYWRTPSYNLTRYVMLLIISLLFGLIFTGADYASYQGVNSGIGMLSLVVVFLSFVAFSSVIPITSQERASFYRERASQTYNALWYFVGSTCAEIPYVFTSALLFTLIFFPMVGFTGFTTAVLFWLNFALLLLMQTFMGQLFAYALPSEEVATILGMLLLNILLLFMGFSPPASAIPTGYQWLYTITPLRFPFSIAVALVFADCSSEPIYDELTATWSGVVGPELGCQPLANSPVTLGHVTVKAFTESVFKMKHDAIASNFVVMLGYIVGFRVLAALALRFVNHQKK